MNLQTTRQKLFESDEFVISELKKLQTLYGLKKEIRYAQNRQTEANTESVAEHVYGMHCLIDYFLLLENEHCDWNHEKIRLMTQYHDIDEVETGDIVGYRKSASDQEKERVASETVIRRLPEIIQNNVREILAEYEQHKTPEAKFVRAIDKIEPVFHLYNEAGKSTLAELQTTKAQHDRIKIPYVQDFPIIKRFFEVMTTQFEKEGFYHY